MSLSIVLDSTSLSTICHMGPKRFITDRMNDNFLSFPRFISGGDIRYHFSCVCVCVSCKNYQVDAITVCL